MGRMIENGDSANCVRRGFHEWRCTGKDRNGWPKPDRCIACGKHETPDYPEETVFSPRVTTVERIGKTVRTAGKVKFKATEVKPLPPMKHDTLSGRGEKRKRYVR